ncbi:citrate/2-methylcitrate synthase [Paenibacillus nasutitermitis]|uniref:Citrate synthase n=1 Tax=Paenibacillus nasutitermitis TaxID=1652958 RepID=A0A916Z3V6_9BACL|nr:citrate/2-methylcitrate synthase [Paenibacillus nasutitermitis]GGD74856.1 citrate synthase 1 [Paenibacillus nasutitermitis]
MKQAGVTGLEGVIAADTFLSYVNGSEGKLVYRGHWAKELALHHSFEEAAWLLWKGRLPDASELKACREQLAEGRRLTPALKTLLDAIPSQVPLMSAVMSAVAASNPGEESSAWPPRFHEAIRITAMLPTIIAYRYHQISGTHWPVQADEQQEHAAYYLHALFGHPASEAHTRVLNAYMILAMEHGLNASTFAARVVSSTESDMYSAVGAAMGAMKGPLHGGAPSGVITLLEKIGSKEQAEPVMREMLENGERLMGFGHRIYKTRDPRAEALREVTQALAGEDKWFDLAIHTEQAAIRLLAEYKPGRQLFTNVEFYAAALMRSVHMPIMLFTPTFTAARVVGWTAHILEQSENNRIFRPQSNYLGSLPSE